MGRMIFDLTDEDRALLEAHRIRMGKRSHAEALRALIRGPGPSRAAEKIAAGLADATQIAKGAADPATYKSTVTVPLAGTFTRKPYQKGRKKP
jgi:hypothetical protein